MAMCSFCGEPKERLAFSEQGGRLVSICESCITWADQEIHGKKPNPLEVLFPDLHKDEEDEKTNPQPVDPKIWEAIFPDHPPESICFECGRRFDDEEHSNWTDGCHFELNSEANRLGHVRREVERLLARGMTPDEIVLAVRQTTVVLYGPGAFLPKEVVHYGTNYGSDPACHGMRGLGEPKKGYPCIQRFELPAENLVWCEDCIERMGKENGRDVLRPYPGKGSL